VGFAAITLCVASQRVFIFVYFVIDSVRKFWDTPSYKALKKLREFKIQETVVIIHLNI
jgi:hypothetical protein